MYNIIWSVLIGVISAWMLIMMTLGRFPRNGLLIILGVCATTLCFFGAKEQIAHPSIYYNDLVMGGFFTAGLLVIWLIAISIDEADATAREEDQRSIRAYPLSGAARTVNKAHHQTEVER